MGQGKEPRLEVGLRSELEPMRELELWLERTLGLGFRMGLG